jgi:hypothetical protein
MNNGVICRDFRRVWPDDHVTMDEPAAEVQLCNGSAELVGMRSVSRYVPGPTDKWCALEA